MNQQPRAIISAILTRKRDNQTEIFLQTRWKPDVSPMYSGMLEIPAGCIDAYENVYDALSREVKEECNLEIVKIVGDYRGPILEPRTKDKAFIFKPFICQEVLETNDGLPWIGFVFLCEVEGEVKIDLKEAKDPMWISINELEKIVTMQPEKIFPLQLPVLKYYLEWAKAQ